MIFSKFSVAFAIVGLVLVHSQDPIPEIYIGIDAKGNQYDIRDYCASGCPIKNVGNGKCDDEACVNEACKWDGGDCSWKYACRDCEWWRVGNDSCDPKCCFDEGGCDNDKNDCKEGRVDPAVFCAKDCPWKKIQDGECDLGCHKESCNFDYGECGRVLDVKCAENCINRQINNDICEPECKVRGCEWDYDDCGDEYAEHCSKDCVKGILGDKKCDTDCLNEACEYDRGDCDCAPGCSVLFERDGVCQPECANRACKFDNYDCECAPGCTKAMVENDKYDSACKFDTCVLELVKMRMIATKTYTDEAENLVLELPDGVKLTIYPDYTVTEEVVGGFFNNPTGGGDGGL